MAKTILAIGGHIGDACLTAGGVMAANAVDGGKNYTLALTAGERGNPPHLTIEQYRSAFVQNQATMFLVDVFLVGLVQLVTKYSHCHCHHTPPLQPQNHCQR